ncbi:uncharacterized protein J4E78_004071 [Alternaria triticimaculans]|uniref:uncharacterized protein n=1 Tax=Alternaria triticimaculans TaxID=297637 RepID=UPI0020C2DC6E|nr:uncharacterized protein J4E78_004071 [Alternaria triticimaculans]KAI4663655.1 hypothetical protein J4E78_004071 [Alternaria triticimaculans]
MAFYLTSKTTRFDSGSHSGARSQFVAAMALNFLTMDLDTVTVRVGEADTAVDITVYRDVLSAVSPYFRSAFEGPFVETTDRSISLTDVTEQTFRMFLQWAHTQKDQRSSGATVPSPAILLQKSTTQHAHEAATGLAELQLPHRARNGPDAETQTHATRAIDESAGRHSPEVLEEAKRLCFYNPEWLDNYLLLLLSFLRLYIFADKYDVPQLRDDVLTALIAQSTTWSWWPGPQKKLIKFTYANLPPSSKFTRFLVLSTAYTWFWRPEDCSATKLRALKEANEDLAFDVAVVQIQRLKDEKSSKDMPSRLKDALPNSCALHDHLHNAEMCRERIYNQPHIFTGLIEMCAQDALRMAKEPDETYTSYKERS